jgi:hypothetical protein
MMPISTKNAPAHNAQTACIMRILSDMRRPGLKASLVPALPVVELASRLEG